MTEDWAGLKIVDVSDPSRPREVGKIDTPGYAEGLAFADDVVFIADGGGGLRVIDVSNPEAPHEIAGSDTDGYAYDLAVDGDLVYLADGNSGLMILAVSGSGAAEIGHFVAERRSFQVRAVVVSGRYAYVAAGYSGVSVVNISDPRYPVEVAHVDFPRGARSIKVSGTRLYVGGGAGVIVLDISDPQAPRKIDDQQTPAVADRIWLSDSTVYVAAREAGLMIMGMEGPTD